MLEERSTKALHDRGAEVVICNRTSDRAQKLAEQIGCGATDWGDRYGIDPDILVEQASDADSEADAKDRLSEANLPKHLDPQEGGRKPHVGPVVKPKAGEKFDDFQLAYALRLLRGQEIVSNTPATRPN